MRLWLTLLAIAASAQPAYEIRAVVVDKATDQAIAGARVIAMALPPQGAPLDGKTDAAGSVTLHPTREGRYDVGVVEAQGYSVSDVITTLSAAQPQQTLRIQLNRVAEVRGRVVDFDTREPVVGMSVQVGAVHFRSGRQTFAGTAVKTDAQGQFVQRNNFTGQYAVSIQPRLWSDPQRHLLKFSAEDIDATDQDWQEAYWPGGGGLDAMLPLPFVPGQTLDVGTIPARKITYRRAVVRFEAKGCTSSEAFEVHLYRTTRGGGGGVMTIPCGQDVLLRGLIPGEAYQVELQSPDAETTEARRYDTAGFVVGDKNLEVRLAPRRGADLEGRVVAEGKEALPAGLRLGFLHRGIAEAAEVGSDGKFRMANLQLGEARAALLDMRGWSIERITLDGTEVHNDFPWAGRGPLEITIGQRNATIQGLISDGDKPASAAAVVLVPWPASSDVYPVHELVEGDSQGRYQAVQLAAGEYRVIAIPAQARERLEEPGILAKLAANGAKVKLDRGGAATVNLKLSDLR